MDNNSSLYYSLLTTNSIAKWNTQLPLQTSQQIIARDPNFLEWPNSFAFDQNGNLTVLVNRLDRFIYDKLDLNQANFRLITSRVGGRSYLYSQTYDYSIENNKATTIATSVNSEVPASEVMRPGMDQDPYLAPGLGPKPSTSEPTPQPTKESSSETTSQQSNHMDHDHMDHDHMAHDHMDHDHMNHDHMNHEQQMNETNAPKSGSSIIVGTFVGVLFASILIVC